LQPQGFADGMDDDAGTMSAWYIWATLGLYPLTPGEPRYLVTAPIPAVTTLRPRQNVSIVLRKGRKGLLSIGDQEIAGKFIEHTMLSGAPAVETAHR
jgi:putative alpha-1,2-mannosidase